MKELRERPWHAFVLLCCVALVVGQQVVRWSWFIEDAAICFAFARNLINGEGLVPSPGGERVEAFSDPLWVALLAPFQAVGLDGFTSAKPVSLVLSVITLWITWRLARAVLPETLAAGALTAPLALALNPQFGIWCASGLENALFCTLLVAATHRTVLEIESGRPPWASFYYLLLAWTRPEGLMYASIGFAVYAAETVRRGRGWRLPVQWALVLGVPFAVSEVFRIWYFAWPLPNTFYAKVTNRGFDPFDWDTRGWKQLREWTERLWHGWLTPVYALGLSGTIGWRPRAALAVVGGVAVLFLWPGFAPFTWLPVWPELTPPPQAYLSARIGLVLLAGAGLPLLAVGTGPGWSARLLCGWSVAGGLLFTLVADGDWMGAYRFMSLFAPLLSVLFALGIAEGMAWAGARAGGPLSMPTAPAFTAATLGLSTLAYGWPWYAQHRDHLTYNHDVTPHAVKKRVDYLRQVAAKVFLEGPITNMDIDQGAFLWWAPDFRQLDFGMLVEVPMARHWFQQRAFIEEYVFDEQRPTFINYGAWWRGHAGFERYAVWDDLYFVTPGYAYRGGQFGTIWLRRDLVMAEAAEIPGPRVRYDWDIELGPPKVDTVWTAGRPGYIEVPVAITKERAPNSDVKVIAFLARDGRVAASWNLQPGYGLLPMHRWKVGEIFRGKYQVPMPEGVEPGIYDLGFFVTGPRGFVVPAVELVAGAVSDPPAFGRGEVRFSGAVEVVSVEVFDQRVAALLADVLAAAKGGACEQAETLRGALRRHTPGDRRWQRPTDPDLAPALGSCWAEKARGAPADLQAEALARSHRWDHSGAVLAEVGGPIGERLLEEGRAARAAQDWELAYQRFSQVLAFQPWQAWARRWAEEARDRRLGLWDDVRVGIGGENDLRELEEAGQVPPTNR
jgi:hypothetical protein